MKEVKALYKCHESLSLNYCNRNSKHKQSAEPKLSEKLKCTVEQLRDDV